MKRPTIHDVAREAGVSKSTVSLVLQNSSLVRDATRDRVEAAIGRLGFVRNRAAANLRGAGTGLVGLVINDLRNPFFTEFAASAQMAFARGGLATVIANTDEDPALQAKVIASMIEHGVTALAICPTYGGAPRDFAPIARAGTPTMQVLRRFDDRTDVFPFASLDYAAGGHAATRHLIAQGARRIVFAGGIEGAQITRERHAGHAAAMEEAGLSPLHLPGRPTRALGRDLAARIAALRPRVDAVLCFSDLVALGMLAGFAEAGIRVGQDVALVGFDDIEEASLAHPKLSSVRCDIARFGEDVARAILTWTGGGPRPPDERRAPVTLVARQSSLGPGTGDATQDRH